MNAYSKPAVKAAFVESRPSIDNLGDRLKYIEESAEHMMVSGMDQSSLDIGDL